MRSLLLAAALAVSAVSAQPAISVAPAELSAELTVGETTSRAVLVGNEGSSRLTYRVRTLTERSEGALYVAAVNYQSRAIYRLDPTTGQIEETIPLTIEGSYVFDGGTLYALSGQVLTHIDPSTGESIRTVTIEGPSGYYYPYAVAGGDGEFAAVFSTQSGAALRVYDSSSGQLLRTLPLDISPTGLAAGEGVYYITGEDASAGSVLLTVDILTGARLRTAAFPQVGEITYSRAAGLLFTQGTNNGSESIRAYDPATGEFVRALTRPGPSYSYFTSIAADEATSAEWLRVTPTSGTIQAGGQAGLTVAFDAGRVVAGAYSADIVIASNDPDEPEVTIAVTLDAIGAPSIAVRPGAIGFGTLYAGTASARAVTVVNPGSDTLRVSEVATSDARVGVSETAFDLLPGDSLSVSVTVTPDGSGPLDAEVTLTTNVEGSESVAVSVTADDVFPPILVVSPQSLLVDGIAGDITTSTLTVSNEGDGPLSFEMYAGITGRVIPSRRDASARSGAPTSALVAQQAPTRDARERGDSSFAWQMSEAVRLGLLVEEDDDNPVVDIRAVRAALTDDSLFVAIDFVERPDNVNVQLRLDLDTDPNTGWSDERLGAEAFVEGYVNYDPYYGEYYYDVYVSRYGQYGTYQGQTIRTDGESVILSFPLQSVGEIGRTFDLQVSADGAFVQDGNYRSGYDVVPNDGVIEVRNGSTWLSAAEEAGTVPAGGSTEVDLTFDATGLLGGEYEAEILVEGNGPELQREIVPVTFTVVGQPAVSSESLALGQVFVGYSSNGTVILRSEGTDDLVVESVSSSDDAVAAALPEGGLTARPGEQAAVAVAVTATEAGDVAAVLTFETNAGSFPVSVSAAAVEPPVATLSAAALDMVFPLDARDQRVVSLENTGGSDLLYNVRIGAPAATAQSSSESVPLDDPVLAAARSRAETRRDALMRTGTARLVRRETGAAARTLITDPDEGAGINVVEIRGERDVSREMLEVQFVFDQAVQPYRLEGLVDIDRDQDSSTGRTSYVGSRRPDLGVEVQIYLYGVRFGEVEVSETVSPYRSRFMPVTIDGSVLSFEVPLAFLEDRAFNFAAYTVDTSVGATDYIPDSGVGTANPGPGWIALQEDAGTVAPGESADLAFDIDTEGLDYGEYGVTVFVSTNAPGNPVLTVPVSLDVVSNVAIEGPGEDAGFALSPPAPNPTSGRARLNYSLATPSPVTIEVFDSVGRRVHSMSERDRSAGRHTADLDASVLPTGVYLVRLTAGAEVAVQRISVVR